MNNIVYRSNLDGSHVTTIVPASGTPSNGDGITDLWVDPNAGKLYWNFDNSLHSTNLDGSQAKLLFTTGLRIEDFDVDPQHGKLYWSTDNGSQNAGSIQRANLDGSAQQTLASGLWAAGGVALDLAHGKMYYTDAWYSGPTNYDATIRMANLDGTGSQALINLGPSSISLPFEITLDTSIVPEPSSAALSAIVSVLVFFPRGKRPRYLG